MTLIYFILILGITVFIHELGHFIFAKIAKVHIYEFSIGMGPCIYKFKRKNDETKYCIRLLPIGGFVAMAGEDKEESDVPKEDQLVNKPWHNRFLTMIAGVMFNFLLAIILLFIVGCIVGVPKYQNKIDSKEEGYPIYDTAIEKGDVIVKYNGKKIKTEDELTLYLALNKGEEVKFTIKDKKGEVKDILVTPKKIEEEKEVYYRFGFTLNNKRDKKFLSLLKYPFAKFSSLTKQMLLTLKFLITGKISLSNLSGPVGVYTVVDAASSSLVSLILLTAYLCINVGIINILPLPAFDGGRAFFLLIEKITRKKVNQSFENTVHTIGFILLMILMILVTYNDIIRLIK